MSGAAVPTTEPVFTTSDYSAGDPRLVIELANGHSLWGYPGLDLSGGTAPDGSGMAWAVDNGSTYTSYATAYATALASATTVTSASVVDDTTLANTPVTITTLQFGGESLGSGSVSITKVAAQTVTVGKATRDVRLSASTTSSDKSGVSIAVTGLPDGLHFDTATDEIYGTPAADAVSGTATVTATDAYGVKATERITYTVKKASTPAPKPAPKPTPTPTHPAERPHVYDGHVITVNNNDAQIGWKFGPGVKYVLTRTFGYDMTVNGKPHYGFTSSDVGYWSGLAAGHTYDIELIPAGANRQPLPDAQVGWINIVTTR